MELNEHEEEGVRKTITRERRLHLIRFIKDTLYSAGLTSKDVAERCGWKLSKIERIMYSDYACTVDELLRICDAVGIEVTLVNRGTFE